MAPFLAVMLGCGAEGGELFHGTGEFSLSIADADGKLSVQRVATLPRLALRRGQRGDTDLVLDRSCALRSLGGSITGTYSCRVATAAGPMVLELQRGTWKLTEQPTSDSVDSCPLRRYSLIVDAAGSIRGRSGTAATLHFEGSRELTACSPGAGAGPYDSLGSWIEEPYTSDSEWTDGYDWDGDGDWDSGTGGDWGGDDGDWGGDDGDGATGHSSHSQQSGAVHSGKPRQDQVITSKVRR